MKLNGSIQVLSTPRTGSSAFGKLLSESGITQASLDSFESQSASEFNPNGYFEDSELNLCLDNLIRFSFSDRNSFLFNSGMAPDKNLMENNLRANSSQGYDLNQDTIEIPQDYSANLKRYTGHDWDVWGLTRMQPNSKWYLAYSRAGVETPEKALSKLQNIFTYLEQTDAKFIKDPRLIYLLPLINTRIRGVIIKRNPVQILRSMRNHYGPHLFTKRRLHSDWVSNHFNYRVQPQEFEEYLSVYRSFEEYAVQNFEIDFIQYEKMYDLEELNRLSRSIGHPLKWREAK
jgi:hypothetical protein